MKGKKGFQKLNKTWFKKYPYAPNHKRNRPVLSFSCDSSIKNILSCEVDKTKFINKSISKYVSYKTHETKLKEKIKELIYFNYRFSRSLIRSKKKYKLLIHKTSGENIFTFKCDKENLCYLNRFKNKSTIIRDSIILEKNNKLSIRYFLIKYPDLFNSIFRCVGSRIGNKKIKDDIHIKEILG